MNQVQFQMPPLTKINKILMIVTGSLFLLNAIVTKTMAVSLVSWFGLSSAAIMDGLIYQLVTYPLIERQLMAVIFNALLLWFLGSELERQWGMKRYLQFILGSSLFAGVVYLLITGVVMSGSALSEYPLSGMQGIGSAMCLAYAILYPDRSFMFMMIFPMKAKWFCALMIGMELYTGFFSPLGVLAWGHLAAMLGGFLMMLWFSKRSLSFPKKGMFAYKMEKKSGKAHLKLVQEDEEDDKRPPKYWQ